MIVIFGKFIFLYAKHYFLSFVQINVNSFFILFFTNEYLFVQTDLFFWSRILAEFSAKELYDLNIGSKIMSIPKSVFFDLSELLLEITKV